jgi:molybdate/tungstate transport system ATP-binding protein
MIRLERLSVAAGAFRLEALDLEVRAKEYFFLLGPSGHGKSVLLETLAGLRQPTSGRVFLEGKDVTAEPPERRGVGYVVQGAALFPHLDVFENLAFPLRVRGQEPRARVLAAAALVGATELLGRMPSGLSGGEAQRVAIARALVPEPRVLVLDEPLASLDPEAQLELARVLRRVHEAAGTTTIQVDHDHERAGALADRVGVLLSGKLRQVGTPAEVFRRPAAPEIARFVGVVNLFSGEVVERDSAVLFETEGLELRVATDVRGRARASLRPEEILLSAEPLRSTASNTIAGKVVAIEERGPLASVTVEAQGAVLVALVLRSSVEVVGIVVGGPVTLTFKAQAVNVF